MLRSKSEAAAKRSVKERIIKTLEEEKAEGNDCVLDAIEEMKTRDLETLPAAQYLVVDWGADAYICGAHTKSRISLRHLSLR